ncbi:hypothetical protein [Croceicoccus sediminis]|uniref:hypothetical protein n=1 Tax=Croceicoccus sediminis TaxID=2571150 RepID=UPI001183D9C1|nr:hypothetical protein [Croceicoccus sediminis]
MKFDVSIQGAHDLIFADAEVRKLIAQRINRNAECRKLAWQDIRSNGATSRFVKDGDLIRFRRSDGQRP